MVWEERWHPLREEWVIIAAHRQDRPWNGETVAESDEAKKEYAENCYLCPGNTRVSGEQNPDYKSVFVFDNDHPCVGENAPRELAKPSGIYQNRPADGIARVVCYSPKHNLTLAELTQTEVENLLVAWQRQYTDLANRQNI